MRTDVLQVFATCLNAGPFLSGAADKATELFGVHSSYRPVHALKFVRAGTPTHEGVMAERVAPWLRRLKSEDVLCIRPLLSPCAFQPQSEAGGQWGMITDGDRGIELWQPVWKARVLGRFDETPFTVTYTATRFSRWSVLNPKPVSELYDRLGERLNEVQRRLETSMDWTAKHNARACCEAHFERSKTVPGMQDLIPSGVERQVAILAASAARSFVFLESQSWEKLFALKPDLKDLLEDLWKETMCAFESAACAASTGVRQAA